jgi:hypothetical protein
MVAIFIEFFFFFAFTFRKQADRSEGAMRIPFFSVYYSALEQMPWTDVFFMGIQAPLSLAVSPNYFWKLEKNAENLVYFWSCTVMLFLCI